MSLCVVTYGPCHCQPDEGIPCPAVARWRELLRQWQFDVGGASERLERETLAAIKGTEHPSTEPAK